VSPERWASYGRQLQELLGGGPGRILEIGIGPGIVGAVLKHLGADYESLDCDAALRPNHVAALPRLPFADGAYDLVAAFEVLEHLPYLLFLPSLREMARVARKRVVFSLPDARRVWPFRFWIPGRGRVDVLVPRPAFRPARPDAGSRHEWELHIRGTPLRRILKDIREAGLAVEAVYRIWENPYHRMFRTVVMRPEPRNQKPGVSKLRAARKIAP